MKRFSRSRIFNENGNSLVYAVVLSMVMAGIGGAIFREAQTTSASLKLPKIKSQMNSLEQKVIELVMTPSSYLNCDTSNTTAMKDSSACQLNPAVFAVISSGNYDLRFDDQLTPPLDTQYYLWYDGSNWVDADHPLTAEPAGLFGAELVYTGPEPIASRRIFLRIPKYVLQSNAVTCPLVRPIFRGLQPDGTPICVKVNDCSGPGQYIKQVRPDFTVECGVLNASNSCSPAEYISGVTWLAGAVQVTCAPRKDPFTYFSFTPTVSSSGSPTPSYVCIPCVAGWSCTATGIETCIVTTPPNQGAPACPCVGGATRANAACP